VLALGLSKLHYYYVIAELRVLFVVITRNYDLIMKVNQWQQPRQFKIMALCRCHKVRQISNAFEERFSDFKDLKTDFAVFSNPFSVNSNPSRPTTATFLTRLRNFL